jgi:hypothetical protein
MASIRKEIVMNELAGRAAPLMEHAIGVTRRTLENKQAGGR